MRRCAGAAPPTCADREKREDMSSRRLSSARWFAAAAGIVVLDQVTKVLVLGAFAPGERMTITSFLNLVLVFNKGAAFSFLADAAGWQTWFFAGFAVVAASVVSYLILKNSHKLLFCAGLALILGGAVEIGR